MSELTTETPATTSFSSTTPPVSTPAAPAQDAAAPQPNTSTEMNVLAIVLLILMAPVGVIVMWVGTKWSKTVKWTITIVVGILMLIQLMIFSTVVVAMLAAVNPPAQIDRAKMAAISAEVMGITTAARQYFSLKGVYPASIDDLVNAGLLDPKILKQSDVTFVLKPLKDGNDCEVVTVVAGKAPIVVTCEKSDLTVFNPPLSNSLDK